MSLQEAPPKAVKFSAFSCTHAPLQDEDFFDWYCSQLKEFDPEEVICLGDLYEADSASRWPSEADWTLNDEFREADKVLKQIRESAPNARCKFLKGNHDDNLQSLNRINSKLRDTCDFEAQQFSRHGDWLNEEFLTNWQVVSEYNNSRNRGTYNIGMVTFGHGWAAGVNSDEDEAIALGMPFGLYVRGHTHRPTEGKPRQVFKSRKRPLPYWYLNVGCSCDMDRDYVKRADQTMWGQGAVFGWAIPVKSPRLSRRTFDAEVRVFKRYDPFNFY